MDWAAVTASGYALPSGVNPLETIDELLGMLGDPNPVVRDLQACRTLTYWIRAGHLDAKLRELGDQCAVNLRDANVLVRSLSALILAEAFRRDRLNQILPDHITDIWIECWFAWYPNELDIRPYIEGGWSSTVDHGARLACQISLRGLGFDGGRRLMQALNNRLKYLPMCLIQGEAESIALAMLTIFTDKNIQPDEVKKIMLLFGVYYHGESEGQLSPGSATSNHVLHSLYTLLCLGAFVEGELVEPGFPQEIVEVIRGYLKSVYSFHGLLIAQP